MSRRGSSLTARLVALVVLSQLLLAAGLFWAGMFFTRRQLRQGFDTSLRGRLMSVAALVRYPESGSTLLFDANLLPPARDRRHRPFYQVRGPGGELVASTFPADVALPDAGNPSAGATEFHFWRFEHDGVPYRGLIADRLPILDTEENWRAAPALLTVLYAAPTIEIEAEVAGAALAIAVTSLVLLALAALLAGYAIRRELDPLRELAQQAAAISPPNWRFQPGPRTARTVELAPLIQALDLMLQRLHASYQQQRNFMTDAAHHLKTPVAILKSTQQSLLQRPRERDEYLASAQASLLDIERLEQLLQRMLRLARLEQASESQASELAGAESAQPGAGCRLPPIQIGATCRAAIERVQPLARSRAVSLRSSGLEQPWPLPADADDLELVWVNLLENAVLHSAAGAEVRLEMQVPEVVIADQGDGIAAADLPYVFERFRRGSDQSGPGFGLGLSIARTIVEACGGAITISSSRPGGTTLRVRLPLPEASEVPG